LAMVMIADLKLGLRKKLNVANGVQNRSNPSRSWPVNIVWSPMWRISKELLDLFLN
jgi:hypothetical protein